MQLSYADGAVPALPYDKLEKLEAQFIDAMSALEEQYQVEEFLKRRDKLVRKYGKDLGFKGNKTR